MKKKNQWSVRKTKETWKTKGKIITVAELQERQINNILKGLSGE